MSSLSCKGMADEALTVRVIQPPEGRYGAVHDPCILVSTCDDLIRNQYPYSFSSPDCRRKAPRGDDQLTEPGATLQG